jgi:hypothetical protein
MPYVTYRLLHLLGVFVTLCALGAMAVRTGSTGSGPDRAGGARSGTDRLAAALHGVGLLLALVAGFGLLARIGIAWPWPAWIWAKVVLWVLLGGAVVVIRRVESWVALVALPLLSALAAYLAIQKPGV